MRRDGFAEDVPARRRGPGDPVRDEGAGDVARGPETAQRVQPARGGADPDRGDGGPNEVAFRLLGEFSPPVSDNLIAMSEDLSATEAARHFSEVLDRVEHQGASFTVVRNGKPVARLLPAASSNGADV